MNALQVRYSPIPNQSAIFNPCLHDIDISGLVCSPNRRGASEVTTCTFFNTEELILGSTDSHTHTAAKLLEETAIYDEQHY